MSSSIEQMLEAAVAAHQAGQTSQAGKVYKAILRAKPKHPDASHNLALILAARGNRKAAIPLFETAVKQKPAVRQFWISYVSVLVAERQSSKAIKSIKKGRRIGAIDEELFGTLRSLCESTKFQGSVRPSPSKDKLDAALILFQNGHYDEARIHAENLTRRFPNHAFGWKVLGVSLASLGQNLEAAIASEKAIELDPTDPETLTHLGNIYRSTQQLDKAEEALRRAINLRPQSADAHSNLGAILKDLGKRQEAIACFERAISFEPDNEKAHNNLGFMHQLLGDFELAKKYFHKACILQPDFADAHNNLGLVLKEQDRLEDAQDCFERAISCKPDFAEAHNNLGIVFQAQNKARCAEKSYANAIEINPKFSNAHNNMGITLRATGRLEDAVDSYKLSISLDPNCPEAHNNLGVALQEMNNLIDAERAFRHALLLRSTYAEAHMNLGNTLRDAGRVEEAEASYSSAIEAKPKFALALMNRWTLRMSKGDFSAALADADACESYQGRSLALETLYVMGEIDEAYRRIEVNACRDLGNIRSAAFAAFISAKTGRPTAHRFCPKPLEFLYFANVSSHADTPKRFAEKILRQLRSVKTIWEPSDKTTKNGFQTAHGINLFDRPSGDLARLKSIILRELSAYRSSFQHQECALIENWPDQMDLFAWHVVLKQQGFQERHLHPEGWISGVVYLQVPPQNGSNEGAIEFGLNGVNYYCDEAAKQTFNPKVGDIVLFPSSLQHRTLPFYSDTERVIISFDLLPPENLDP